ncbi:MAG: ASPIC/UnbV domain-containing protein [Myxococcota bacterium]
MRQDDDAPDSTALDRSTIGGPLAGGYIEGVSFSGNERNNLFLSLGALDFEDVSGVSGIDHPADGRSMGLLDYDRDGWLDLAIVNANSPLLQLFRNRIEDLVGERPVVAVRFVGGNRTPGPVDDFGPRDGIGAIVEIQVGNARLIREHRAGEGFAAQNSATLFIGLGIDATGGEMRVRWPSGRVQELGWIDADSLVTVYEDALASANGSGFSVAPYRVTGLAARAKMAPREEPVPRRLAFAGPASDANGEANDETPATLTLITTMATWCEACKAELPQIKRLRREFSAEELDLLGVPIDENDDARKLAQYVKAHAPAYRMLDDLTDEEIAEVQQTVLDELRIDALPAAIITDDEGRVLRTMWEIPSVSDIREFLAAAGR